MKEILNKTFVRFLLRFVIIVGVSLLVLFFTSGFIGDEAELVGECVERGDC